MSFFDPHHVYDKKKRKSHKGQIIQKRLGTQLIPPMSREELSRVRNYLISNGIVTEERRYSKTVHKTYFQNNFPIPSNEYIVFLFSTIYNNIFKAEFEWKVSPTGTNQPKSFEVLVALNRIEYKYRTTMANLSDTIESYIPQRTESVSLTKSQNAVNQYMTYTPQDVSFCQFVYGSGNRNVNFTTVNNYSYLLSYHSYDVNDYRKFALGSDLPVDELFGIAMTNGAAANTGDIELELIVTIKYTY